MGELADYMHPYNMGESCKSQDKAANMLIRKAENARVGHILVTTWVHNELAVTGEK